MLIKIPSEYILNLSNKDYKALIKMLKILISKYDLVDISLEFDDFSDLKDWIDEYLQEGHIL